MASLIASGFSGSVYWLGVLIFYGVIVFGGLLFVAIVGGFIYSSIKSRRR
jgi:hypothetical protein